MTTAATYVPILGDFSSDSNFSLQSGDATAVPVDATAAFQGTPRAGTIKWAFLLLVPDPTGNDDDDFNIQVPVPRSLRSAFTTANFLTQANRFYPIVTMSPLDAASLAQPPLIFVDATAQWSAANFTVGLHADITSPAAAAVQYQVTIDFSHSVIN